MQFAESPHRGIVHSWERRCRERVFRSRTSFRSGSIRGCVHSRHLGLCERRSQLGQACARESSPRLYVDGKARVQRRERALLRFDLE
jgi:hypothetical protein